MPMRTFCAEHPMPHFLRKSIQAKGIIRKCSRGMASLNCFMALLQVNLLPRSNKMRLRHTSTGVLPKDSKSYHFSSWIRTVIFTPTFSNISNNIVRICLNLEILLCLKLFWSVPEPNVMIRDPPWLTFNMTIYTRLMRNYVCKKILEFISTCTEDRHPGDPTVESVEVCMFRGHIPIDIVTWLLVGSTMG